MNKLFIVPSNIFTFSFGNHRPAQAVILLYPKIRTIQKCSGRYPGKGSVRALLHFNDYTGNDNYNSWNCGTTVH